MKVTTHLGLKEYLKLLFSRAYHKPLILLIVSVGVAMAVWIIGYYIGLSFLPKPQYFQYTTLVLITVVQPVALLLVMRKTYRSSGLCKS